MSPSNILTGHFLNNKKYQFDRRVKFDVCRLATYPPFAGGYNSPITPIGKIYIRKVFQQRSINEKRATVPIAKIQCQDAEPVVYTTVSEVAVLQYGHTF